MAVEIAAQWQSSAPGLTNDDVQAVLADSAATSAAGAHIVCLGKIDVPAVGDVFFEPEIITPTRYLGRQLFFIPIAGALVALWLLQTMGVIPFKAIRLSSFSYFLVMGAVVGVTWVWRTALRPTYIRMAPGVIQILEYRYGRAKPLIRSYRMDSGTLAILRGKAVGKKRQNLTLTLMRGEQEDTMQLWRTRKRDNAVERMWQALLSTAPTPPLSDEELVG